MAAICTSCQESIVFFAKHNIAHEVSAPYHPESNNMTERLIQSLKDRLSHVNEDQGFYLKRNLNVAVSAYRMVPHRATGFLPFVLLYGREASMSYEIPFTWYDSEEQYQDALSSHIEKMFEIHKRVFFSNRKYQMKMKETFDRHKVHKEIVEFQIGKLVWFDIQRQIPDMKFSKAKWVGPCNIVSISKGGLFKLAYEVNKAFVRYEHIHPQLLKWFCGEPL